MLSPKRTVQSIAMPSASMAVQSGRQPLRVSNAELIMRLTFARNGTRWERAKHAMKSRAVTRKARKALLAVKRVRLESFSDELNAAFRAGLRA